MKFYAMNHEQLEKLGKAIEPYLTPSDDVRTVLKDMYCDFFMDKTDDIGYAMADEILAIVSEYNQDLIDVRSDPDSWLEKKVQSVLEGKETLVDRCNALYRARITMEASNIYSAEGEVATETFLNMYEDKIFFEEDVSDELESTLRDELKDAISNNKILSSALDSFILNDEFGDDSEVATVPYGEDSTNYKALLAMQAYLQSGEDGNANGVFPQDMSLHDITYSVCAAVDTMSISGAVENGEITEEEGTTILERIGMILGASLSLWVSLKISEAVFALLGSGILATVGGIILTFVISEALAESFIKIGQKVAHGVKTAALWGVKLVAVPVKKVFSGIKKLFNGLTSFFKGKKTAKENQKKPYTVPKHNQTEASPRRPFFGRRSHT